MNLYCIAGHFEFITMICCLEGLPPFLVGGHRVDVKKFPDDDELFSKNPVQSCVGVTLTSRIFQEDLP